MEKEIIQKSAADMLKDSADLLNARGKEYEKEQGERSMAKIVAAFNIITGHSLSEADGWEFMSVLKQVRLFTNRDKTHSDSCLDSISYSALLSECAINKGNLK